jgi:hypothetical protein
MGDDKDFLSWKLDEDNYSIQDVALRVSEMYHTQLKAVPEDLPVHTSVVAR